MGQAIGQVLPLAIGVALSPIPIIAVILMLGTPRAHERPAFLAGWLVGLAAVGTNVLTRRRASASDDGQPAGGQRMKARARRSCSCLPLRQWRGASARRRRARDFPTWMGASTTSGAGKAFGRRASLLAGVNPKNLLLDRRRGGRRRGAASARATRSWRWRVRRDRDARPWDPGRDLLRDGQPGRASPRQPQGVDGRHNAAIMAVVLLVIGAKLIGEAIGGFSGKGIGRGLLDGDGLREVARLVDVGPRRRAIW